MSLQVMKNRDMYGAFYNEKLEIKDPQDFEKNLKSLRTLGLKEFERVETLSLPLLPWILQLRSTKVVELIVNDSEIC